MRVGISDCEKYDFDVVLVKVRELIRDLGISFKRGKRVLVKPNILGQHRPDEMVTTHPVVVEAVVKCCLDAGMKVTVGDSAGFYLKGGTDRALEVSGMSAIGRKYSVTVINLECCSMKRISKEGREIYIAKEAVDSDLVINLPKLKTHTLMKYTGAVKNLFGCVPGGRKQGLHVTGKDAFGLAEYLLDIYEEINPQLNIMDGVYGIEGNGPGSAGKIKKAGMLFASTNGAALDHVASSAIGFNPFEIITNSGAVKRGIYIPNEIDVIGNLRKVDFKRPVNAPRIASPLVNFIMKRAALTPFAIKSRCKKCNICRDICPVNAINMDDFPKIDKNKCIHCYCCHENCPHKAMELKGSKIVGAVSFAREIFRGNKR